MQKYVLIISQYYHSYIMRICKNPKNVIDKSRKLIRVLEEYKRCEKVSESKNLGDLGESEQLNDFRKRIFCIEYGRLNVNDVSGDIYFIFSSNIERLVEDVMEYTEKSLKSRKESNKSINEQIQKHHNESVVDKIIRKYFEVL